MPPVTADTEDRSIIASVGHEMVLLKGQQQAMKGNMCVIIIQ